MRQLCECVWVRVRERERQRSFVQERRERPLPSEQRKYESINYTFVNIFMSLFDLIFFFLYLPDVRKSF